MIIIQSISTMWGKLSRGGIAAGFRNQTPDRVPVRIPDHIPTRHIEIVLHEVRFGESSGFELAERTLFRTAEPSLRLGCIELSMNGDRLAVVYNHTWLNGGSPRRYGPVDVATLDRPGSWAQVAYNGRHSPLVNLGNVPMRELSGIPYVKLKNTRFQDPHSLWWYEKHVYNIALAEALDPDVFMTAEPAYRHRNMARLR